MESLGDCSKTVSAQIEITTCDPNPVISNDSMTLVHCQPIEEMLGSVTTYNNLDGSDVFGTKNFQQLRTSARVFKKMKLDSALAVPNTTNSDKDKKDLIKEETKLEVKKPLRPSWSQEDKDIFFEALNEYGKDFEAIQQHINIKFKKKGLPESVIKTKDQVRHFYYRTWHKVSKHLKFSEDIKKIAQELYALINYGELRKKVGSVSEKICIKLNELIYRGTVHIRVKGKTIRVKTPMCRALRKLNELDEKHDDLKLPTRILVELRPKNMESWLKVQFMAQNPRVRVPLPLTRRVSALLHCMSDRWRTYIARAHEKILNSVNNVTSDCIDETTSEDQKAILSPLLRFTPKADCLVEVPTINLSEYLTSHRICLNAYEERVGVKTSSEQLWQNTVAGFKGGGKGHSKKGATKRQRVDSAGEKTNLKQKEEELESLENPKTVNEVVDTAVNTILALQKSDVDYESLLIKEEEKNDVKSTHKNEIVNGARKLEQTSKIKNGWTLEDCGTLTIGELYLMFGHDSKLILEYSWDPPGKLKTESDESITHLQPDINTDYESDIKTPNELSVTLKKLLSVAKLHYRKEKVHCPCGHVCGGPSKSGSASRSKNITTKTNQKNIGESQEKNFVTEITNRSNVTPSSNCMRNVMIKQDPVFRRPSIYPGNGSSTDSFRAQLDSLQKMRPRYCNRRGRPARSKHVVVERMLPLLPKPVVNGHSIVTMKVISQVAPRPIAPKETEEEQQCASPKLFSPEFIVNAVNSTKEEEKCCEKTPNCDVSSPTSISSFLDLDIPTADTNDLILSSAASVEKEEITSFAGLLSDENPCTNSTPLSSPSRILKDTDIQWLNAEVNDYSLTSLLGHLESPMKVSQPTIMSGDDSAITQDIDAQFPSLLGENGVDFVEQFVDMAAHVNTEPTEMDHVPNL